MQNIQINKEPVELYKILKFEGLASSGAEAKLMIAGGLVRLNGTVELQKRKKTMANDIITIGDDEFKVIL